MRHGVKAPTLLGNPAGLNLKARPFRTADDHSLSLEFHAAIGHAQPSEVQ